MQLVWRRNELEQDGNLHQFADTGDKDEIESESKSMISYVICVDQEPHRRAGPVS